MKAIASFLLCFLSCFGGLLQAIGADVEKPSAYVVMIGARATPEAMEWTADLTVVEAVFRAGGPEFHKPRYVYVKRGEELLLKCNLKKASKDPAEDLKLQPGDRIIIPE